jgi:hypothetical protein
MDSRNSESEGICQGCVRRTRWQKPAIVPSVKTHPHTMYPQAKMWRTNGNISGTTSVLNSIEWMQINPEILVYLSAKGSLAGGGLRCNLFWKVLRMLDQWKATCIFNLNNLIRSEQILEKTTSLILTMISLLNALLLTTQYTHQHHRRRLGRLLSEGRGLGVESAHWRKRW